MGAARGAGRDAAGARGPPAHLPECQPAEQPGGWAAGFAPRPSLLVIFVANAGGSRRIGVAVSRSEAHGAVYVLRGLLTARRVAGSVAAWLQHLLA
jgi:hypothetical protein